MRALLRLRALASRARLHWRLARHPEVPLPSKLFLVLLAIYAVMPIDLVPDWVFGVGLLDDLSVVLGGLWIFERLCPREVVEEEKLRLEQGA